MGITAAAFGHSPEALIAVPVVACVLVTIAVALRVYCRISITGFGLDDWLLLIAFAIFIADSALLVEQGRVELSAGLSTTTLTLSRLETAYFGIYLVNQVALKLALAFFFNRIVTTPIYCALFMFETAIYSLFTIAFLFASLFRCGATNLIAASYFSVSCASWSAVETPLNVTHAVLNAVIDMSFAVLAILVVLSKARAMREHQKLIVIGLVALATAGGLVSVVRIPFIAKDTEVGPGVFGHEVPVALLSVAETGLGICCLACAALKPLVGIWMRKGKFLVEVVKQHVAWKKGARRERQMKEPSTLMSFDGQAQDFQSCCTDGKSAITSTRCGYVARGSGILPYTGSALRFPSTESESSWSNRRFERNDEERGSLSWLDPFTLAGGCLSDAAEKELEALQPHSTPKVE